jgi:hypothetical protein
LELHEKKLGKAEVLHMAAFAQGPSLGWMNAGPLAVKASKEHLVQKSSVSEDIRQKLASEHSCRL